MIDELASTLRARDRDRYVSVLYAPAEKRPALIALYAFNAEIASVRDRVHEALPGEIRLQWWRDVVQAGTKEAAAGHPLATALLQAINTHRLPAKPFLDMLEARIFDLYNDPMPSRGDLEGYCGETASALIQLAALVLDREAAPTVTELAGHAGCAQAIAGLLRLLPQHRARGQCYIPTDMLSAAGTTPQAFIAGENLPALSRALEAVVALGREHWRAYSRNPPVPVSLRPAFLSAAASPDVFNAAIRAGTHALSTPVYVPAWRRQLRALLLALGMTGTS